MATHKDKLSALFVGLGSIGTRHLRNLSELCENRGISLRAEALRSSARPLAPEVAALLAAQHAALPEGAAWDLAFITGPTHLHADALRRLKGRAGALFIEKPIFAAPRADLPQLGLGEGQRAYVAAPMRHTALYAAVEQKLAAGLPVYSARVLCSSYLPDWRPGADYRAVYSAKRKMGGGVSLDLIHEWDYLYGLFGPPEECQNLRGRFSHLEIDSDDLSVYIARWPGFLCEVHLDYFGRRYRRELELFSEDGSLTADFGAGLLHLPNGSTEDHAEHPNRRYQREMEYFLDYALGPARESMNSPHKAQAVLKLTLGDTP